MEELNWTFYLTLFFIVWFAYWRGTVNGYNYKIKTSDKSKYINVYFEKINDQYFFYTLEGNKFLRKFDDLDEGCEQIVNEFAPNKTVIFLEGKAIDPI